MVFGASPKMTINTGIQVNLSGMFQTRRNLYYQLHSKPRFTYPKSPNYGPRLLANV